MKLFPRLFPQARGARALLSFAPSWSQLSCIAGAVAVFTLSACSGSPTKDVGPTAADPTTQPADVIPPPAPQRPKGNNNNASLIDSLFDAAPSWNEQPFAGLPALPQQADLLPFDVSRQSQLTYYVDGKSVSIGKDGVVRLTVVITSPEGARNVYYEGVRCATFEWRLYAAANESGTKWDRGVENDWNRIGRGSNNSYQSALYSDYLCQNKTPTERSASTLVSNIKYHRVADMPH